MSVTKLSHSKREESVGSAGESRGDQIQRCISPPGHGSSGIGESIAQVGSWSRVVCSLKTASWMGEIDW